MNVRFTSTEQRLIARLSTPLRVQRFLNDLTYNAESVGQTLRSFRGVLGRKQSHCLEAALFAATVLEQHGHPPLLMSLESIDYLDHVVFVYREAGGWGSIARSRDPGLHGRKPLFRSPRNLALSYVDPYIDFTGRIKGYGVFDLRELGGYDWRLSSRNVWKVEQALIDLKHRPIHTSDRYVDRQRRWYVAWMAAHPGKKPIEYRGRERWSELPRPYRK